MLASHGSQLRMESIGRVIGETEPLPAVIPETIGRYACGTSLGLGDVLMLQHGHKPNPNAHLTAGQTVEAQTARHVGESASRSVLQAS